MVAVEGRGVAQDRYAVDPFNAAMEGLRTKLGLHPFHECGRQSLAECRPLDDAIDIADCIAMTGWWRVFAQRVRRSRFVKPVALG